MAEPKMLVPATTRATDARRTRHPRPWVATAGAVAVVAGLYTPYLVPLFRFAASSTLYSHVPLVPLVTAWLLWIKRDAPSAPSRPNRLLAVSLAGLAVLLLAAYWIQSATLPTDVRLTLTSASCVLALVAVVAWRHGAAFVRTAAFPLGFLVFMVPLPTTWMAHIETVLQHGSAFFAHLLFQIAGTPVFYGDLLFQLPGITLRVAPECSGIHSTLALTMVSLLAGHLFLHSTAKAAVLTALVFPLALLRNGFRIFVVGELCVTRGPQMIESPIHRQGGPIFFALSLVPFLVALWLLVRSERRGVTSPSTSLLAR